MNVTPSYRAAAIGLGAAALLIGSFLLGTSQSGSAATGNGSGAAAVLDSSTTTGKITVTGTGTVTGVPNQLVLSMGVQVNSASVSSALNQANAAIRQVTAALGKDGVSKGNIQTSDLSIQPNFRGRSQVPVSYGVSEQMTVTLTNFGKAGTQIQDAVTAGGNLVTVSDVSVNLTNDSALLAKARAKAVADAQAKASQYASALHETVTGVISVSDQTPQITYPLYYGAAASGASAPSVPVSPGKQQVSVQITVVYGIG
jgi:uncharacterized protein